MLPGMYVDHDGDTCQVRAITGESHSWSGDASTLYTLQPVLGGPLRFVRDPMATDVPLTPACDQCHRPAGHQACKAYGQCQGLVAVPVPVRYPSDRDNGCHCGACPDCWSYLHGHPRPLC